MTMMIRTRCRDMLIGTPVLRALPRPGLYLIARGLGVGGSFRRSHHSRIRPPQWPREADELPAREADTARGVGRPSSGANLYELVMPVQLAAAHALPRIRCKAGRHAGRRRIGGTAAVAGWRRSVARIIVANRHGHQVVEYDPLT